MVSCAEATQTRSKDRTLPAELTRIGADVSTLFCHNAYSNGLMVRMMHYEVRISPPQIEDDCNRKESRTWW